MIILMMRWTAMKHHLSIKTKQTQHTNSSPASVLGLGVLGWWAVSVCLSWGALPSLQGRAACMQQQARCHVWCCKG